MEFSTLVQQRRMTRAFASRPVESRSLDRMLDLARRAPSAGNTAALDFLLLTGPTETGRYWDITLPAEKRAEFQWPHLLAAPVLIVPWVHPDAYVARYAEPDKAHTALGTDLEAWPVPYWFVDGGAAAMTLLLAAEAEGLGALLFGLFGHEAAVRNAFGVPPERRAIGAIAIGHRAPDRPSNSAARRRPNLDQIVHRGHW